MKTTLIVAAMNEIDGMKAIMPRIDRAWCDQIIILDGRSTDGTAEWAEEQGYEVYVQKGDGLRAAYFEVLELIRGDVVITFSPDGNSVPEAIPELIEKMKEGYDLVIASRYLGAATSKDDDWLTGFGNWFFTKTINVLFGGSFTDSMVILRAFRLDLLYELDLHREETYTLPEKLFSTPVTWEPLMSARAAKCKKKVAEIPFDEPARIGGERKMLPFRWGAAFYFQFLRELWYWPCPNQDSGKNPARKD